MSRRVAILGFFWLMSCPVIMAQTRSLAKGADISWLSEMEAAGRRFYTASGMQKDLFDILKEYCLDAIRLRVWVNPPGGWSGERDMLQLARRAHQKGFRLMVDFHYSDSWADPGQQNKPAAWIDHTPAQLEQVVYDHTTQVLRSLKNEGIAPEWVQIGNETNDGLLWPDGRASVNMAQYARLITSGHRAAKAVFPQVITLVHLANGYDNALFRWNIGGLIQNGALFDGIAMSLYPEPSNWDSLARRARANMDDLVARYGKPIMVSEIGLSVGYPEQSKALIETMISLTRGVSGQRGLGVFWWEPQAYNWRGYTKVAWDNNGRPTRAMEGFKSGGCAESSQSVQVTFRVNMTGQNLSGGVYITGSMTGPEGAWQIVPMDPVGQNVYTRTFSVPVGDSGAYYYLNGSSWDRRERVPPACALWYGSDRGYRIAGSVPSVVIEDVWGQCEAAVLNDAALRPVIPRALVSNRRADMLGRIIVKHSGQAKDPH